MRVRIVEDCRDNPTADLELGTYIGNYPYKDDPENPVTPKIILDSGDVIWGIECWWERVSDEPKNR